MTTSARTRKRPATYADLEAVPPNLVAEILGGELVLWYLDPEYKTLEVFKHNGDHWQELKTFGSHDDVHVEPFDAISFSLGALWPYDPPPATGGA